MQALGYVKWFDKLSQEGIIRTVKCGDVYINNDPVHGHRLNEGKPLQLENGQNVLVEVFQDYQWQQVSKIECIYPIEDSNNDQA